MVSLLSIASAVFLAASATMTALSFGTYFRTKRPRFLALAMAFAAMLAGAIWTAFGLFTGATAEGLLTVQSMLLSLGLLIAYFAVVKR